MIRREFWDQLGGFDPGFIVCEDYELWLRASLNTVITTLDEALVIKQGGHLDQLSKKYWGMDRFRVRAMEKILEKQKLSPNQKNALVKTMQNKLTILAKGYHKRNPGDKNPYEEKIKQLKEIAS